jgi:hypothetical protein
MDAGPDFIQVMKANKSKAAKADPKKLYLTTANTLSLVAKQALLVAWSSGYVMLSSDDTEENKILADARSESATTCSPTALTSRRRLLELGDGVPVRTR